MTRWLAFSALVGTLGVAVLLFARSSARLLAERPQMSGRALRWNVVGSQSLLAALVLAGAWATGVPWDAFGWHGLPSGGVDTASRLLVGGGLGVAIAAGNVGLERVVDDRALRDAAALRRVLAPGTTRGWLVLLFVAIPAIAVSEELLFRGALVGALAVGFDLSPWGLAVASSLLFGAAHTAQGLVGVVVTATFGLALAAAFVFTGDLLVVVLAHAVVDWTEFLVHEGPLAAD